MLKAQMQEEIDRLEKALCETRAERDAVGYKMKNLIDTTDQAENKLEGFEKAVGAAIVAAETSLAVLDENYRKPREMDEKPRETSITSRALQEVLERLYRAKGNISQEFNLGVWR